MRKILIIPAYRLYPVDSGGAHAQLAFLEKLQHGEEVDILVTPDHIAAADLPAFRRQFSRVHCIETGYTPVSGIKKLKAFIRKLSRKLAGRDHAYRLRKYGLLNGLIHTRPDWLEEVRRVASAKAYDLIQAEHAVNMGLIEILPASPKKVFVHHEIAHTRIHSDMRSMGYSETYSAYISGLARQLETAWLNRYDGVITLCREDAELLQVQGIDVPMQVARPFALFKDELKKTFEAEMPPCLLFVGGESHYPNKEGLHWFLGQVYPLVKKEQVDCRIRITGSWSPDFRKQYAHDPGIQFTGFVKNLEEVYRDSILVAPVRIGSGVRIKVITALAQGVPVAGTALGLSGIPGILNGQNAFIADDPEGFAGNLVSLLRDQALRSKISEEGFQLARNAYLHAGFAEERRAFYGQLLDPA